jgi:hypothetical protein
MRLCSSGLDVPEGRTFQIDARGCFDPFAAIGGRPRDVGLRLGLGRRNPNLPGRGHGRLRPRGRGHGRGGGDGLEGPTSRGGGGPVPRRPGKLRAGDGARGYRLHDRCGLRFRRVLGATPCWEGGWTTRVGKPGRGLRGRSRRTFQRGQRFESLHQDRFLRVGNIADGPRAAKGLGWNGGPSGGICPAGRRFHCPFQDLSSPRRRGGFGRVFHQVPLDGSARGGRHGKRREVRCVRSRHGRLGKRRDSGESRKSAEIRCLRTFRHACGPVGFRRAPGDGRDRCWLAVGLAGSGRGNRSPGGRLRRRQRGRRLRHPARHGQRTGASFGGRGDPFRLWKWIWQNRGWPSWLSGLRQWQWSRQFRSCDDGLEAGRQGRPVGQTGG